MTTASTKTNRSNNSTKSTKLKPLKTEKTPRVPSIAVHHPYRTDLCPPQLMPSLSEAPADFYPHSYAPIPPHSNHLAPLSPRGGGGAGGALLHNSAPGMIPPQSQHSTTAVVQGYQLQSPKMAQLSPGSAAFPSNQASPHPAPPPIYTSDPASPMQVTYSPSQPLMQMTSSGEMYHGDNLLGSNAHGHNIVSVAFTAAGQAANIGPPGPGPGLHHPHYLPPPNYTEAVGLNATIHGIQPHSQTYDHLSAAHGHHHGYDPAVTTCAVGGDYHGTTLPTGMLGMTGNHF